MNMPSSDQSPLVSIVIANHNYGRFLSQAIASALAQSHSPIEVVVVDDGSSDDSLQVAHGYPVKVISQVNRGVCAARNRGASEARGGFFVFLDADDMLDPDYVARTLTALLAQPLSVAYSYTHVQHFGSENRVWHAPAFSRRALINANVAHAASLVRAQAFSAVGGFDESWLVAFEDHELWLRMLSHGFGGVLVPEALLLYRRHGPSRSAMTAKPMWDEARWRTRLSYPQFFWSKLLFHPIRALRWAFRLRHQIGRRPSSVGTG
jgi:glycosyltransferase involved in cell wall biosynthesis